MTYLDMEREYRRWRREARDDKDVARELEEMEGQEERIEDAFYRELAFGTGGLRGLIGAGTNRMNVYTVAKATQGAADYIKSRFEKSRWRAAVSYDSRIKSRLFAETAARVMAANGIKVRLFRELAPTPCLSFAVRELNCALGIMITSSHNPARYNGYKVYGPDGCQITARAAADISEEIKKLDIFRDIAGMDFGQAVEEGRISYTGPELMTAYIEQVKAQSLLGPDTPADRSLPIIYTPLNGTGLKPVLRALRESGFENVSVVVEQEKPDGLFPTCPYPNPEVPQAMELGIRLGKEKKAALVLATDPDCDRVGIAVPGSDGEFVRLSANETGLLLLEYICERRLALGTMPKEPVMAKTIVTTSLAEAVGAHYGVRTVNVLTGFKYIGEYMGRLEREGRLDSYIFGFEESCGYLSGPYVRDKDGVNAAHLICEMAAYYQAKGLGLLGQLERLYDTYGFCLDTQRSYAFEGAAGAKAMEALMEEIRKAGGIKGLPAVSMTDYAGGVDGLPPSNVLKFALKEGSLILRPSGTEPKLKVYISLRARKKEQLTDLERQLGAAVEELIGKYQG